MIDGGLFDCKPLIPRSSGGESGYSNLQLLHRHCHDIKTSSDGSLGRTHEKGQVIEEPYERKVCAVVRTD